MTTRWTRKDLLGLRELSADEINFVLETADAFKQVGTREIKKVPALRGKTLVNFFVEPSTRTRTSFELAAFRLSADVINISATTSSLTKGETLKDTARGNSRKHQLFERRISLNDFVRNPAKRATDCLRVHDGDGGLWILFCLFHAFPSRPRGIALKEKN